MTQAELNALVQLLQRIPVSQAEAIWLQGLMARLQAEIQAKEQDNTAPRPLVTTP